MEIESDGARAPLGVGRLKEVLLRLEIKRKRLSGCIDVRVAEPHVDSLSTYRDLNFSWSVADWVVQ